MPRVFNITSSKEELEILKLQAEITKLDLETQEKQTSLFVMGRATATVLRNERFYPLRGYVNMESLNELTYQVNMWTDIDARQKKDGGIGPLTISITSPGGDVFAGFGQFDLIRDAVNTGLNITTEIRGYAASMGSMLAQAGLHRTITRNSWGMIHEAGTTRNALTQLAEMRDQIELLDQIQERMLSVYAERSFLTVDKIKDRISRKDCWLNAEEMLTLGLVDEITSTLPAPSGHHVRSAQ